MKSRLLIVVVISSMTFLLSFYSGSKQSTSILDQSKSIPNKGWFVFKQGMKINPDQVFENNKDVFGLSSDDQMQQFKESKTEIPDEVFYKYQQYYKGIKVAGAVMSVRSKNKIIDLAHGKIFQNININIIPSISEEEALNNALERINAPEYAWENEKWELQKKTEENSATATWYPKAELQIVTLPGFEKFDQAELCLVYRFDIQVSSSNNSYTVEVNAYNGEIVRCHTKTLSANGTVLTVYNDQKNVTTYYRGLPYFDFVLQDRSRTNRIDTREFGATGWQTCWPTDFWTNPDLDDHDNFWHSGLYNNAASAHWAVSKTYEFYATRLYRTTGIREVSGYDIRVQNRFYTAPWNEQVTTCFQWGGGGDYINVGYLLGTDPTGFEGGLDVLAHEFTHGVGVFSAGLDQAEDYPAGPLLESFCDILGESVESYVNGSCDYIMGTNLADQFKRCFANPNSYRPHTFTLYYAPNTCYPSSYTTQLDGYYPTTYSELLPGYDGTAHKNSAIQNRWFYLLVNGDPNLGVQGIGITSAYRIAYRTLVYHISGVYDDYFDSRLGTIQSASELFGECSNEYKQVMNAWAAVGVGTPAPNPCVVPLVVDIVGPVYANCGTSEYYYAYVNGGNGNYSYEWSVNFSPYSYDQSIYYYFPEYQSGTYYFSLTVTDGEQTAYDNHDVYVDCYMMQKSGSDSIFVAYPNPTSDNLTIKISNPEIINENGYLVNIFDKNGKKVYSKLSKETEMSIDVSNYISGNYIINVSMGDKQSSIMFIKK